MEQSYDKELRDILCGYEIREPGFDLMKRTSQKMHEELTAQTSPALAPVQSQAGWVFMLAGLAIAMSLCLFYMLTVGTILWFVLPANMLDFLRHLMYAFTAAGGSVLAGVLIVLLLKQFQAQHTLRTDHVF
ncbi:hypothetical protein ACFL6P_07930 [Candidatus Latescibacterota bacterium]